MKKRIYLFSIIIVALLIGISALTIVLVNKDTSEKEAEEISKVKFEDEFTDLWNKINITLNEKSPNNYYFENMDLPQW
ncbi:hypothetical protein [Bacillus sp. Cr_A10]|uniref:hypothetical protein n=1 Tax=Bacillus sp. Cr_A10 TaxID=3033993 RepID=UPI0023DC2494|nr:hypothetical protein [Bacillus sp. Cr_A10]MDF2066568.1 hypothetical protein [Bacillus sp. Cr_A10]